MNSKGFNAVMLACLWTVLAFMYIPIIAIIGMSFNATPYGMFPYVFTTDWYVTLFTDINLLPEHNFEFMVQHQIHPSCHSQRFSSGLGLHDCQKY